MLDKCRSPEAYGLQGCFPFQSRRGMKRLAQLLTDQVAPAIHRFVEPEDQLASGVAAPLPPIEYVPALPQITAGRMQAGARHCRHWHWSSSSSDTSLGGSSIKVVRLASACPI